MKTLTIASLLTILFINNLYSQNGIYKCEFQAYINKEKFEHKTYSYNEIITVEVNDILGGEIVINNLTEDFIYKYEIIPNTKRVDTDKADRSITTSYKCKVKVNYALMDEELLIAVVEYMDNSKLDIWVYDYKHKSFNQYIDLIKAK